MEECRCIDDIHLVQELAPIGARIVDVSNDKGRFEPAAVYEEVISDVYQWALDVEAVNIVRRCPKDPTPFRYRNGDPLVLST